MDTFIQELMDYIQQSEQRGNKVISIAGVKAIHERYALRNDHSSHFRPKYEHNIVQSSKMPTEANTGVTTH